MLNDDPIKEKITLRKRIKKIFKKIFKKKTKKEDPTIFIGTDIFNAYQKVGISAQSAFDTLSKFAYCYDKSIYLKERWNKNERYR